MVFMMGHFPGQPCARVLIVEAFLGAAAMTAHGIDPKEYAINWLFIGNKSKI